MSVRRTGSLPPKTCWPVFEPGTPRLFGLAPGVDFPRALVAGIASRLDGQDPSAIARVELYVNTERMRRRITSLYHLNRACFLPRIRLVTELARDPTLSGIPQAADPLARRLELAQLVRRLIAAEPDMAAQDSAYDLAESLANLMDEMQGEGVSPDAVAGLNVGQLSDYWARSQRFIALIHRYFGDGEAPDAQARQRRVVAHLTARWETAPPDHPILVAGSTGSRGTTNLFMRAVARLPQGAVILPGYDDTMSAEDWAKLDPRDEDALGNQDHPQYRFRALMRDLDLAPGQILAWHDTPCPSPARNAVVSLALRPAPVTDSWMTDGKNITDIDVALAPVTLIEAETPRLEALAIAARLREAAEAGQSAALITPDRQLTRQVTAALQRWRIEPDDSAGIPLAQTAPGRLLRQLAELMHRQMTSEHMLSLLKHPLVDRKNTDTRIGDLELGLLRRGLPFPSRAPVVSWAEKRSAETVGWVNWLFDLLDSLPQPGEAELTQHLERLISVAEQISAGYQSEVDGPLWELKPGEKARETIGKLRDAAPSGGLMSARDFADLLQAIMSAEEVRDPVAPHAGVMIWGTLEARVQGADLVILAGLNDGIWPEAIKPDPWLNRQMRMEAGLLVPERNIGLAAHDFQQAVAAKEVLLTRATRDAEAQTVPSRWLNRLSNLLRGLSPESKAAYDEMKARGDHWLRIATALDTPRYRTSPARRPAPRPEVSQRPTALSVTQIQTLIRDPYAIYARYILDLRRLDPLVTQPAAPLRGQALHEVLQKFTEQTKDGLPDNAVGLLMKIADAVFETAVPWPATRHMWRAKLERSADWFIGTERERRRTARPIAWEVSGEIKAKLPDFTLEGRADRIDQTPEGALILYDYKTGSIPSNDAQRYFDKQLPLLGCIAERGGFEKLAKARVLQTGYIGLGSDPKQLLTDYSPGDLDKVWEEFTKLIARYAQPEQGYLSRRALAKTRFDQDYDHLARYGEWDHIDPGVPEEVSRDNG